MTYGFTSGESAILEKLDTIIKSCKIEALTERQLDAAQRINAVRAISDAVLTIDEMLHGKIPIDLKAVREILIKR